MKLKQTIPPLLLVVMVSSFGVVQNVQAGPYRDYASFIGTFKNLSMSYPNLLTYEVVGKTVENRDILLFKIGNPNEERILIDGGMHGWESLGGEVLFSFSRWLLTSNDPVAETILSQSCFLMIPALNADRYNIGRTNTHGVDLNRNFETNWRYAGSSDPDSEYYRGPYALSEPESQTLSQVFQVYRPSFYVNLHMGGGPLIAGCSYANRTLTNIVLDEFAASCRQRGLEPYPHTMYGSPGLAMTDAAVAGITSFLLELCGDSLPSYSEIEMNVRPKFVSLASVLSRQAAASNSLPPWDVNQDGKVDSADIALVVRVFPSTEGAGRYSLAFDMNRDGQIDMSDVVLVIRHFGEETI